MSEEMLESRMSEEMLKQVQHDELQQVERDKFAHFRFRNDRVRYAR